jgi:hypothetical protein
LLQQFVDQGLALRLLLGSITNGYLIIWLA